MTKKTILPQLVSLKLEDLSPTLHLPCGSKLSLDQIKLHLHHFSSLHLARFSPYSIPNGYFGNIMSHLCWSILRTTRGINRKTHIPDNDFKSSIVLCFCLIILRSVSFMLPAVVSLAFFLSVLPTEHKQPWLNFSLCIKCLSINL